MNNYNISYMILNDVTRITQAISTGAAWEIWMQVELVNILHQEGIQAAREVPYPSPNQSLHLDALAADNEGQYAIELKVESANNSGVSIIKGVQNDIEKITKYHNPEARWVIAIGYSSEARKALRAFAFDKSNNAIYNDRDWIGVLVVTV